MDLPCFMRFLSIRVIIERPAAAPDANSEYVSQMERGHPRWVSQSFEQKVQSSDAPFIRSVKDRAGKITAEPIRNIDICRLVKRQLRDAGLPTHLSPHSFRVATVTDLLTQGVALDDEQSYYLLFMRCTACGMLDFLREFVDALDRRFLDARPRFFSIARRRFKFS
jgi:hypothetical protein